MDASNILRCVLLSHEMNVVSTVIEIDHKGKIFGIRGQRTSMVAIGVPTVALLSPDSTPQKPIVPQSAKAELRDAMILLIEQDRTFYTALRPSWAIPEFFWNKV